GVASIADSMIRDWGMGSFKFAVDVAYGDRSRGYQKDYGASPETEREIELEIKQLVDGCLNNVQELLRTHRAELDRIAHALLEKETLYYRDIAKILEPSRSME